VVNWRGKLDSREHQGRSLEFCPPSSQPNLHNTFEYPPQLVVSNFTRVQLADPSKERVKETVPLSLIFQPFFHAGQGLVKP